MTKRDKTLVEKFRAHVRSKGLDNKYQRPKVRPCLKCLTPLPDNWVMRSGVGYWEQLDDCPACEAQHRQAVQMDNVIAQFDEAGMPDMFQIWTSSDLSPNSTHRRVLVRDEDNRAAWDMSTAFIKETPWLILGGTTGVGKTSWASGVFADCVDDMVTNPDSVFHANQQGRRPKPFWLTEAELFMRADLAHADKGYVARTAFLDKLCRSRLLMIDDLGGNRRALTEWQGGAMRHLFDYRYARSLPTLLTTNLNWDQLQNRYGKHIISRMLKHCGPMRLLGGDDRRL